MVGSASMHGKDYACAMKRIPYAQMILGLDQLFMGGQIKNQEEAEKRADTIDAYLEACGWTWDSLLEHMSNENDESDKSYS